MRCSSRLALLFFTNALFDLNYSHRSFYDVDFFCASGDGRKGFDDFYSIETFTESPTVLFILLFKS